MNIFYDLLAILAVLFFDAVIVNVMICKVYRKFFPNRNLFFYQIENLKVIISCFEIVLVTFLINLFWKDLNVVLSEMMVNGDKADLSLLKIFTILFLPFLLFVFINKISDSYFKPIKNVMEMIEENEDKNIIVDEINRLSSSKKKILFFWLNDSNGESAKKIILNHKLGKSLAHEDEKMIKKVINKV